MNGEVLATGAGLLMITTEGDEAIRRGGFGSDSGDNDGNGFAQSLNFSNGAGKLSKIDFLQGSENQRADADIVSFNEFEEGKGERRSDFNEDLLNSSGSQQLHA